MKKKLTFENLRKKFARYIIIPVISLLLGCTSIEGELTQVKPTETTGAPTTAVTITNTPLVATRLSTPVPTQTNAPTPTALPATPTLTPTPEPVPTLTISDRQVVFQEFMRTNGGCTLPCWWGIELGESLESVNQRFTNLGMPWLTIDSSETVTSDQTGYLTLGYIDEDGARPTYRLNVDTEFHKLDGVVDFIYIFINRPVSEIGQQEFIRDWEQYYLPFFLQQYGQPSQVYFRIRSVGDLMLTPQFSISLLYLDKGLAITYHVEAEWLDDEYTEAEMCLDMVNLRALELSLFNPDNFDKWGYQFAPYHDEKYELNTWEAETGMALDLFFETYQQSENLNCIYLSSR